MSRSQHRGKNHLRTGGPEPGGVATSFGQGYRRLRRSSTCVRPRNDYHRPRSYLCVYLRRALQDVEIEGKANQTMGSVFAGLTNANTGAPPCAWHVIRKGKVVEGADSNIEILDFGPADVFIKGANAVDPDGNTGVFASNPRGGTIGMCWPIVTPRGSHLIQPVGLEKLVSSVIEASQHSGIYNFKYSTGLPVKLIPVVTSKVITEIQAFGILLGIRAHHLGSGGIGGSEGAVVLVLEGTEERMKRAFQLVKDIKGEPPLKAPDSP